MVDLKRKQMSLFLIWLLQFTAAAEVNVFHLGVREGDEVRLPCINMKCDQNNCHNTSWNYYHPSWESYVQLDVVKSGRLSLTEDCSLVIKPIIVKDAGWIYCEQLTTTEIQTTPAVIRLFVEDPAESVPEGTSPTEHPVAAEVNVFHLGVREGDEVRLPCINMKCDQNNCHNTAWNYRHPSWERYIQLDVVKSGRLSLTEDCSLVIKPIIVKDAGWFYCEQLTTTEIQTTPAVIRLFVEDPAESVPEGTSPTEHPVDCTGSSALDFMMLVLHVAELILMTVITVLLFRTRGTRRPPYDNTVLDDEDEGSVYYDDIGEPSASVRLHSATITSRITSTHQIK
nr:uncharacterized protein LOC110005378 isoform X2 [Labrus bergylta]XP_029137219.1 uncharacterized protein LOC109999735 isoform X2 [Labrus bergylta]